MKIWAWGQVFLGDLLSGKELFKQKNTINESGCCVSIHSAQLIETDPRDASEEVILAGIPFLGLMSSNFAGHCCWERDRTNIYFRFYRTVYMNFFHFHLTLEPDYKPPCDSLAISSLLVSRFLTTDVSQLCVAVCHSHLEAIYDISPVNPFRNKAVQVPCFVQPPFQVTSSDINII